MHPLWYVVIIYAGCFLANLIYCVISMLCEDRKLDERDFNTALGLTLAGPIGSFFIIFTGIFILIKKARGEND